MALAGQSAAFLAGQQHGAKLAVQHSTPTAAPKGAAKKAAPTLLDQAKALAAQDTAAQVGAYKAQQDTYTQQGQDRAAQINLASQAAAKLLQSFGLADNTANSYNNGAATLAGIAGGYSGDLKNTATDAASQVQAQLANLGAPAGSLKTSTGETANPTALGNVLYGLGGAIPANLLVNSGQAAAAAQRGLPSSTLAFGQQQAAGTLAAAQQQADQLNPQILAARAGNPAAIRQYLSSLLSAQNQQFGQKLDLAKYKTGIDEFNASQSATAAYRQTQNEFRQQGLRLQEKTYNLSLQSAIATGTKPNAALSKIYGYVVDASGNPVLDVTGKTMTVKATDGTKPLSAERIGILTGDANALAGDAFNGFTDAKTNKKFPPLNFGQALAEMRKGVGNGTIPLPLALKALGQAGYKIPPKYDKLMGGLGQQADPFGSPRGLSGVVRVAPTANRAGTSINPAVTTFVAQVAGIYGKPLTIGTGTNHNEYVLGTHRISDHFYGNAADIPASGAELTRLGQDALIAAGMPVAEARRQTGGLFNIGDKQIIFNSMEGGNHYTHLHVGVRG